MEQAIILYDIPGNSPSRKAWSPSTWKARFALNVKGIPYRTEWVEYPDIIHVYEKYGLKNLYTADDGSPLYTLPIIYDPSTEKAIPESTDIAKYLDKTYPDTPILFPRGTLAFHAAFRTALGKAHNSMWYIVSCAVCDCLNERSQEYYRRTREADEGKKLEEIREEKEWEEAEAAWTKVADWFDANGEGHDDLVMGEGLCFADIGVASVLMWAKYTLPSEEWARICSWNNGKWKRIADSFIRYSQVDVDL